MPPGASSRPALAYFPGVRWDDVAGTDLRLASAIGERADVLWVDPALSALRVLRGEGLRGLRRGTRIDSPAPGVTRVQVVGPPWPDRRGVRVLTARRLRAAVRRAARRTGLVPRAVLVSSSVPRAGIFPSARYVYYATDDLVAGAALTRTSVELRRQDEARQLVAADVVAAVSDVLAARWAGRRDDAVIVPNGCDASLGAAVRAAEPPAEVDLPHPVAGVVGQLSRRIDLALLEAVADAGTSLLLVGPVDPGFRTARLDALLARPSVRWVDRQPLDRLPAYYRAMDLGLTPYVVDDFNRASVPLKTLEYVAAGLPVVSTDLPSLALWDTPLIRVGRTPAEFVSQVGAAAEVRERPDFEALADEFRRENSWQRRAGTMLAHALGQAAGQPPTV